MATGLDTVEKEKKQFIVVKIGSEQYGIDINYIDNIVVMQKITRVPRAQTYFKGIINLRGEIVPVMSIRLRMGLADDEFTGLSRIIILKIDELGKVGIIVDEVKEVVMLAMDEIDRNARNMRDERGNFVNGIGKNNGQLISLLEIDSIIEEKEVAG